MKTGQLMKTTSPHFIVIIYEPPPDARPRGILHLIRMTIVSVTHYSLLNFS